jgi:hypothetical protein
LFPNLIRFQKQLGAPTAIQIVHKTGVSKKLRTKGLTPWIIFADQWLTLLP